MTLRFHPDGSTLAGYAAGGLAQPIAILVGAHVELCPDCRREFGLMRALGGEALACAPVEPTDDAAFDRLLLRLDEETATPARLPPAPPAGCDLPGPLARFVGGGTARVPWKTVLPGVEHHRYAFQTSRGEHSLRLLRAGPGREIPHHSHAGQEATLVLSGALGDGDRVYNAGEFCDLDETTTHNPKVHGDEICICAIAEEGPPNFVSADVAAYLRQAGI